MESKKNTKADVGRNSSLYVAVGLALMLFLSYSAINYTTTDKADIDIGQLVFDNEDDDDVPITEMLNTPPPPPPPPAAPEVIEVVEDEEDVEETIIESTETTQEEVVEIEIADVEVEAVEEEVDVPFSIIENVPVYPGCEGEPNNDAKKKCMSEKIGKFVRKNFNNDLAQELGLDSGIKRINVGFKIDKTGNIVNIQARAPHPKLEAEAKRVISKLPKMKAGRQRGKAVNVPYGLPITFKVE
ncbi:MAG: protein TonB [Olleya marilimosa]|jgi:protein TonB|uniref:Energy transducer TonB n=1 Tax=Olleya marilimosa TaxID=272164 RepID=A0ABR8M0D9_9FLAO|nr:energy transducer TonB [Olleya marilimosa]MBD3863978.1 energy transducer TonB [Olleya marilimosa]PIB33717.1 energy transducer TonB [Gaetbulibacter sp. 5U11]|tara:strand:+ start:185385 stop:186110 length:726 start_codon:yes stop_codon:yes gene_type:complete